MNLYYGIVYGTRMFFRDVQWWWNRLPSIDFVVNTGKIVLRGVICSLRTSEGTPAGRWDRTPTWLACQVFRYWHCASVIRFDDKREAGCLNCMCDFCPRLKVPRYFRTGFCRAGEGLYKWDGLCNVKIGEGRKKKIRVLCVREAGGGVVPVLKVLEDRMYYDWEAAEQR